MPKSSGEFCDSHRNPESTPLKRKFKRIEPAILKIVPLPRIYFKLENLTAIPKKLDVLILYDL